MLTVPYRYVHPDIVVVYGKRFIRTLIHVPIKPMGKVELDANPLTAIAASA